MYELVIAMIVLRNKSPTISAAYKIIAITMIFFSYIWSVGTCGGLGHIFLTCLLKSRFLDIGVVLSGTCSSYSEDHLFESLPLTLPWARPVTWPP